MIEDNVAAAARLFDEPQRPERRGGAQRAERFEDVVLHGLAERKARIVMSLSLTAPSP